MGPGADRLSRPTPTTPLVIDSRADAGFTGRARGPGSSRRSPRHDGAESRGESCRRGEPWIRSSAARRLATAASASPSTRSPGPTPRDAMPEFLAAPEAVAAATSLRAVVAQPNVVAIGIAEKETDGQMTGELALTFYVEKKHDVPAAEAVPAAVPSPLVRRDVPTDVVELGVHRARGTCPEDAGGAGLQHRASRHHGRHARGAPGPADAAAHPEQQPRAGAQRHGLGRRPDRLSRAARRREGWRPRRPPDAVRAVRHERGIREHDGRRRRHGRAGAAGRATHADRAHRGGPRRHRRPDARHEDHEGGPHDRAHARRGP